MQSIDLSHRKARRTLRVTDEQGRPLADAALTLQQTSHAFLFGCGAFEALEYANLPTEAPLEKREALSGCVQKWLALFNYGTLPFYWGRFEPVEGQPQTEHRMNGVRFLREHGVTVKGHPLCWHTVCADWLLTYDDRTILEKQLARIRRDVTAFQSGVRLWDVINEVVIMPDFDRYDNAVTRLCRMLGRVELVKRVFQAARETDPNAVLLINDFNVSPDYEALIDSCLQAGVDISAIGIQSHQHQGYWGQEKLEEVLERFGRFGLPLHFTENSLVSGPPVPPEITDLNDFHYEDDASTPEGEEQQAAEMEEMVRVLFACPCVEAVTNWSFRDGSWLNAPSGLVRRDNSVKPVYERLHKLIKDEWWTRTTLRTDENGVTEAEGFKGGYRLGCDGRSAVLELTDGAEPLAVRLIRDAGAF